MPQEKLSRTAARCAGWLALASGLAACSPAPVTQGVHDPYEVANRKVHAFNKSVDTAFVRPLSGTVTRQGGEPGLLGKGIGNFSDNLREPARVVNSLLQLRIAEAAQSGLRFVFNSTLGVAGVFDPATALGVQVKDTDFGETLHVWGMGEGAYVELPLLGASTGRDTLGMVVDYAINPTRLLLDPPQRRVATAAAIASKVGDRGRYSDTIDSILYDSADSYAQARLLYLQNRRFELGQTETDDNFEDPYAQ